MKMESIEEIIQAGPNSHVEFLKEIVDVSEFAKICVSFVNQKGGEIIIGVNEKHKIIGVNPEEQLNCVAIVSQFVDERILFNTKRIVIQNKFILQVSVSKGESPVKLLNRDSGAQVYYIRLNEYTLKANKVFHRMLNMKKFNKDVAFSNLHDVVLSCIEKNSLSLSQVYKLIDLKPKIIDQIMAELLYMNRIDAQFVNKKILFKPVE